MKQKNNNPHLEAFWFVACLAMFTLYKSINMSWDIDNKLWSCCDTWNCGLVDWVVNARQDQFCGSSVDFCLVLQSASAADLSAWKPDGALFVATKQLTLVGFSTSALVRENVNLYNAGCTMTKNICLGALIWVFRAQTKWCARRGDAPQACQDRQRPRRSTL